MYAPAANMTMRFAASHGIACTEALARLATCGGGGAAASRGVPWALGSGNIFQQDRHHASQAAAHGSAARTAAPEQQQGTSQPSTSSSLPPPANLQASSKRQHSAPALAGLRARYPDPQQIPEHVLQRVRAEVFGEPVRAGERTGRRALAKPLQGKQLAEWYFLPPRDTPGFHNEEQE